MTVTVTNQAELDQAIADGETHIGIDSPGGVWLRVDAPGSSRVEARGSSSVEAWGSSRVVAWGSSRVVAWGSSRVVARGSSSVEARGSSSVEARGSSSVVAWDSSSVEAWDSSRVEARGSSRVVAWGSSSVVAWGSSSVEAWGSSRVEAWGSSSVVAWDSSSVVASSHVAVHLHSGKATIHGGVLINHTTIDLTDPQQWCDYHGVAITDGNAYVYKAVDEKWTTDRGTLYAPGATPDCPDWRDDNECGGGLHFSPSPAQAREYHSDAVRYVRVGVALEDLRPIVGGTPKCKAPRVTVACVQVDLHGDVIESGAS